MFSNDSYIMSSGIILSRKILGENTNYITMFLKHYGIVNASSPSRLYSGDREPLIWGKFKLRKKSRSRNYFIEDVDITDDMLSLRKSSEQILTALKWCRLIIKYLEPSRPDDELLANLYWNMKLLAGTSVPPEALSWRFIWRWLNIWGLAPDIENFLSSNRFSHNEIILLSFIAQSDTKGVSDFFHSNPNVTGNFFRRAYDLSLKLLNEK